jgi:hypothetical protein
MDRLSLLAIADALKPNVRSSRSCLSSAVVQGRPASLGPVTQCPLESRHPSLSLPRWQPFVNHLTPCSVSGMRQNRTGRAGSRKGKAGGVMPAVLLPFRKDDFSGSKTLPVPPMAATLDDDLRALSEWMRRAWRRKVPVSQPGNNRFVDSDATDLQQGCRHERQRNLDCNSDNWGRRGGR